MGQVLKNTLFCFFILVILYLLIGLPLTLIFGGNDPKHPIIIVESSTVKAYNLTSDNHLFCIFNLELRVRNPNTKKHVWNFRGVDMEARKGRHRKLADDKLPDFDVGPDTDMVVVVEAVGLDVGLKRKIAAELRTDVAAGEGHMNLFMNGFARDYILRTTCKNVLVDFSVSTKKVQSVDCGIDLTLKYSSRLAT